jgi:hypothetical protein
VIDPYYEAGKESWTPGHTVRIDDRFDMTEGAAAAEGLLGGATGR